MNKKSLSTLEFYKITDQLVSYACCDGAKKILRNLKPMTDITDINLRLDETNDALSRIFQKGTVDFSQDVYKRQEIPTPRAIINGTVIGPVVTPPESNATARKPLGTNIASAKTIA